jgi:hypothetical protein
MLVGFHNHINQIKTLEIMWRGVAVLTSKCVFPRL